jgi:SAM-dependent methyltransferase
MDRLAEQRDYYRQRAPEYDEWWQRQGRYELDPQARDNWFADMREVERAIDAFGPAGDVLELAAGTGWRTQHLARHARQVTAVDASAEVPELNRRRSGPHVTYLQADLFDQVAAALRPGGRVARVTTHRGMRYAAGGYSRSSR